MELAIPQDAERSYFGLTELSASSSIAFSSVGRFVELVPGDPVSQDDPVCPGGTGQFAGAEGSLTGTVSGRALFARNPDGSCSFVPFPTHEVDKLEESGTLSF